MQGAGYHDNPPHPADKQLFYVPSKPEGSSPRSSATTFSAYRLHVDDPVFFEEGGELTWRNGDVAGTVCATFLLLVRDCLYETLPRWPDMRLRQKTDDVNTLFIS